MPDDVQSANQTSPDAFRDRDGWFEEAAGPVTVEIRLNGSNPAQFRRK